MSLAGWGDYLGSWYNYFTGTVTVSEPTLVKSGTATRKQEDLNKVWAVISNKSCPYPQGSLSAEDFKKSFGNAWNYLWEEARQVKEGLTPDYPDFLRQIFAGWFKSGNEYGWSIRNTLITVFERVFVVDVNTAQCTVRPDFIKASDSERQFLLSVLLVVGFRPFKLDTLNPLPDTTPLFAEQIREASGPLTLKLGYRADDRSWSAVQAKGFERRLDADDQVQARGLKEPWSPFSIPEFSECLWFRRGQDNLDNCLNSVVSVAIKFDKTLRFPKLNDATLFPTINVETVRKKPYGQWPNNVQLPQGVSWAANPLGGAGQVLKTVSYIYAFKVNGLKAYNTQLEQIREKGTPYAERGVQNIPPDNILARISVDRYHLDGPNQYDVFYIDVTNVEYTPNDEAGLKAKLMGSDDLLKKFKAKIESLRQVHTIDD